MSHLTLDILCLLRRECNTLPMLKRCTIALKGKDAIWNFKSFYTVTFGIS